MHGRVLLCKCMDVVRVGARDMREDNMMRFYLYFTRGEEVQFHLGM